MQIPHPGLKRLRNGVAANALGKVWVLLLQLLSVPMLTHYWGVEEYGIWLMLITIPTYLGLSDFGLATAAAVDLNKFHHALDEAGSRRTFQSVWLGVTAISISIALICIAGYASYHLFINTSNELPLIYVVITIIYGLLIVQTQQILVVYRATRKYARGTLIMDSAAFAEGLVMISTVALGGSILTSLIALVACRTAILVILNTDLKRKEPWLKYGFGSASIQTIKSLANPSLGAVALNFANSFAVQGAIIALGLSAGSASVALFATSRLITRMPLQITGLVTRASVPEITAALHTGESSVVGRLLWANVLTSLVVAVPFCAVLLLAGPLMVELLSHGQMRPTVSLMIPLTLSALASAVWASLATGLIAMNKHSAFSFAYLLASILVVAVAAAGNLELAAWGMLAAELVALCFVLSGFRNRFSAFLEKEKT